MFECLGLVSVGPTDPANFADIAILFMRSAAVRATRVDPMKVLRYI